MLNRIVTMIPKGASAINMKPYPQSEQIKINQKTAFKRELKGVFKKDPYILK
ncbi:hypothetical protein [Clostridium sp.]|uniref:hypothetical protein n=1 Tax=Clostridium sp. TaxID=1506 RepID=UPI002FCBE11B